jgi:hypothetical protein
MNAAFGLRLAILSLGCRALSSESSEFVEVDSLNFRGKSEKLSPGCLGRHRRSGIPDAESVPANGAMSEPILRLLSAAAPPPGGRLVGCRRRRSTLLDRDRTLISGCGRTREDARRLVWRDGTRLGLTVARVASATATSAAACTGITLVSILDSDLDRTLRGICRPKGRHSASTSACSPCRSRYAGAFQAESQCRTAVIHSHLVAPVDNLMGAHRVGIARLVQGDPFRFLGFLGKDPEQHHVADLLDTPELQRRIL